MPTKKSPSSNFFIIFKTCESFIKPVDFYKKMPRSKRYQVVNLNKTKKKVGKQVKEALIDKVKR